MRRLRFAFLLFVPCLSGCTFAIEDCWCDRMKVIDYECAKPNPTTVASK